MRSAAMGQGERLFQKWYAGKRVLITGGLGFLGSNLAIALVRLGARVTLLDALIPLYGGNRFNINPVEDDVEVAVGDIREEELIREHVTGKEVIFHIAAQTSHVDSMLNPFLDLEMNCKGTLILLEACKDEASKGTHPPPKVVYAGTRAQYGKLEKSPVTEAGPMNPVDIYGIHKHAGEQYLFIYGRVHGIPVTSLRINNTYGPRHQMKHGKYGILNWFIRLALDGEVIPVYGEGDQLRDFNYVDDVTRAFLLAGAMKESEGEAFNLGSGKPIKFVEMVRGIVEAAGSGSYRHIPWPDERKRIEPGDFAADFSKIQRSLGWKPELEIQEGLRKTVEFYREHRHRYWSPKEAAAKKT